MECNPDSCDISTAGPLTQTQCGYFFIFSAENLCTTIIERMFSRETEPKKNNFQFISYRYISADMWQGTTGLHSILRLSIFFSCWALSFLPPCFAAFSVHAWSILRARRRRQQRRRKKTSGIFTNLWALFSLLTQVWKIWMSPHQIDWKGSGFLNCLAIFKDSLNSKRRS